MPLHSAQIAPKRRIVQSRGKGLAKIGKFIKLKRAPSPAEAAPRAPPAIVGQTAAVSKPATGTGRHLWLPFGMGRHPLSPCMSVGKRALPHVHACKPPMPSPGCSWHGVAAQATACNLHAQGHDHKQASSGAVCRDAAIAFFACFACPAANCFILSLPPVPPQAPSNKSAKGWVVPLPINTPPINPLPLGSFPIHPFARSPFAFGSFLLRQPATPLLQTARPPPPTPVFNQRTATRRRTPHISSHASQVPRTKGLVWRSCPKLLCGPCPGVNVVASPSGHSF